MTHWIRPYKTRRVTNILSYAVKQNYTLLETGGEHCYLLQRLRRSNDTFQVASRRVSTLTVTASSFSIDPDTGYYRYELWNAGTDPVDVYPDIGTLTATVQVSGVASVWEVAVDKYSFITDRTDYAFDIFQNQLDSSGAELDDAVYMVFNTPPFTTADQVTLTYGTINPQVDFSALQPTVDNQPGFQNSLFSFEQWLDTDSRIRLRTAPNQFILAFPGVLTDIAMTEGGFLRQSNADYWTTPSPYSPIVVEHDVVVRKGTGQRFQVVNYTPIYIENILVSQHFDMAELDPRSSIYAIPVS